MKIEIIGIVYVLIVLIFTFIGLKKGFFKALVLLIKSALSFTISAFISQPIASLMVDSKLGADWSSKIAEKMVAKDALFSEIYTAESSLKMVDSVNLPDGVKGLFSKLI